VRKAIKIKALMLLTAWTMIFAHSIIPHNHPAEYITGCHELLHKTAPVENDCNGLHKFKNQPEDIKVCHISGFLFQQFNQDNYYFKYTWDNTINPVSIAQPFLHSFKQDFVSDHSVGSTSLRAPPVV
jgi:hypothetical protein